MTKKIKNIINSYYYFFDHKLKNTTIIVGLIGVLILLAGMLIGGKYHVADDVSQANILEVSGESIMKIGNQEYRVSFEKLNTEK